MNIQNIIALSEQLQSLGFENNSDVLLKRICFKPDGFLLSQKIAKGKDKLTFQLCFKRNKKQNIYFLTYYDAILQKETMLVDAMINGINTTGLEKVVAEIDWKSAFDFNEKKQWNADDTASWEIEKKIESVIEAFIELEKSEHGKAIAESIKLKYWTGFTYQEIFGKVNPTKNKSEISQRFYFTEDQEGISVDEAFRFLQNRWLEKQIQAKRKQSDEVEQKEKEKDGTTSTGNALLKKNRLRGKVIRTKSVQN